MNELFSTDDYHPSLHDTALARACNNKFFDGRLREFDTEDEYYLRAYKAGETLIIAQDYEQLTEFELIAGDECQNLAGFAVDPIVDGVQAVHRYGGCPYYADAYDWFDYGWDYIHSENWDDLLD